ncbi:hypothetical protein [uncultured Nostoc sp.]|uniref:hypothetical protein n=1 Tax=uncultured Nostoc sp. TaxID=340711 RepID=UPI0035CAA9F8
MSFEEQLHLTEEEIIRRHNQQMFLRRNAQLLQQELSLEAKLLEENPELAQTIHSLNMREIQSNQRGLTPADEAASATVLPSRISADNPPSLRKVCNEKTP